MPCHWVKIKIMALSLIPSLPTDGPRSKWISLFKPTRKNRGKEICRKNVCRHFALIYSLVSLSGCILRSSFCSLFGLNFFVPVGRLITRTRTMQMWLSITSRRDGHGHGNGAMWVTRREIAAGASLWPGCLPFLAIFLCVQLFSWPNSALR